MGIATLLRVVGTIAVSGALALTAAPAMADCHQPRPKPYVCTGGEIPSGNYASITVKGTCSVAADAVIKVDGDVKVAEGATLDAQSAPSTITVRGDVFSGRGSLLGLGCQPPSYVGNSAHACTVEPDGHSTIMIKGNVTAIDASTVLLNGDEIRGNVTLLGGGADIPWSIKNNTIGRNLTVSGQKPEWLGVLYNKIGGNTILTNITLHDPDPGAPGVYIVSNTIGRNLVCAKLSPGVSGGFIPGAVNVVGGTAYGQCASLV